jgi:hypothetical protein
LLHQGDQGLAGWEIVSGTATASKQQRAASKSSAQARTQLMFKLHYNTPSL